MATSRTSRRELLMSAAADAVARGFALIPLAAGAKTPILRRWELEASRDLRQVRRWLQRDPLPNLGVAAGPSGLLVVDLDVGRGEPAPEPWRGARSGQDVFARLAATYGHDERPATYTVSTPSGGLHLYFRPPDTARLGNTVRKLGWCIDTRGRGGYIVAAAARTARGAYTVVDPSPVAPLPRWLLDALTPRPVTRDVTAPVRVGSVEPYVQAAVLSECAAVRAARVGTRNVALHKAARICGEFVGAGRLPEDHARAALRDAASAHVGVAGCTRHEVEQTIQGGLEYGRQRPRVLRVRAAGRAHPVPRVRGAGR